MATLDIITSILPILSNGTDGITDCGGGNDVCAAVSACSANNPCEAAWQATYTYYADQQYQMAKWQAVLGLAYGYLQYQSADRTADRQYDIANRQMCIAEEEYARYKCVYVECEDAYAAEVCAEELPDVEYDLHADRAERDVRKKFTIAREKVLRSRNRYCVSDTLYKVNEMEKVEALALIAARDNAYRYAESRQDFYAERRRIRRTDILAHGRGIMTGQSAAYQSGMGAALGAIGAQGQAKSDLFTNLAGVGNSFLNAYYSTQTNPFPYGSGYTGSGAAPSGGGSGGVMSGFPSGGGAAFAG